MWREVTRPDAINEWKSGKKMESRRKRVEKAVKKPFDQNGFIGGLRRSRSNNGSGLPLLHGHIIVHVREAR